MLNGLWILDKRVGAQSMHGFFETMSIPDELIQNHLEVDKKFDTMLEIRMTSTELKMKSYYLQDVDNKPYELLVPFEKEVLENDNTKRTFITCDRKNRIVMKKSICTLTCCAEVCDTKEIVLTKTLNLPEDVCEGPEMMRHSIKVKNFKTGKENTTIRYFLPLEK
mmetsp:Transcript_6813/g.7732  ORF Transcript_6813/g.7732 Transcript_6813/m.7732 type:complete len:165 (+) Transcript_6813:190-684(+)